MMLCIGISINLNGDITINNATIKNKLSEYDPAELGTQKTYSLNEAAEKWANALVSQLTTIERVALAYHCLNDNSATSATENSPEPIKRILQQITYAKVPVEPDYTRKLAEAWGQTSVLPWSWTTSYDIPVVGRAVEAAHNVQQAIKNVSYTLKLDWPHLYHYLSNDKLKPIDLTSKITSAFWIGLIKEAKKDIESPSFKENIIVLYKKPIQEISWDTIRGNLVEIIQSYLVNSYENKKIEVPTKLEDQIINQIDSSSLETTFNSIQKSSVSPQKQMTQISSTTPAIPELPYLDEYLRTTLARPYNVNGEQNDKWYNEVLAAATYDYIRIKNMNVTQQISLIASKIMPHINRAAELVGKNALPLQKIYEWLAKNWPPKQQQGWFSNWWSGGQQQTLPQQPIQQPTQQQVGVQPAAIRGRGRGTFFQQPTPITNQPIQQQTLPQQPTQQTGEQLPATVKVRGRRSFLNPTIKTK